MNWRKINEGSIYLVEMRGVFHTNGSSSPFDGAEMYVLHKGTLIRAWLGVTNEPDFVYEMRQQGARSIKQLLAKYHADAEHLRVIKDFEVQATKVGTL